MIVTPIEIAINQYLNLQRATSSPKTVEYYLDCFSKFENFISAHNLNYVSDISQDIFLEYIQYLRNKGIKNVSVNTYTRGIRAFANWCVSQDYIEKSFCKYVRKLRDDSDQVFPLTSKQVDDIDAYFGVLPFDTPECNNMNYFDMRNYIVFHLMLDCGLRRQEVINLDIKDVQVNCLVIRNSKFNKSRIVPLPELLHDYIRAYINLEHRKTGPVLLERYGNRITADCIRKIFYNIRKEININCHPHLLRHTFATSFIAGGGNLEFLRIILGHASYNITQRYLHIAAQCTISDIDIYKLDSCFFRNYNNRGVNDV